jgi:hypothetical protein
MGLRVQSVGMGAGKQQAAQPGGGGVELERKRPKLQHQGCGGTAGEKNLLFCNTGHCQFYLSFWILGKHIFLAVISSL